jgi:small subunit ribosomal protein S9
MPDTSSKPAKILSQAVGRRKTAIASVRLVSGPGEITVNGKPATHYFPTPLAQQRLTMPFEAVDAKKYSASIKVQGGGPTGQLDAAVLGLSRALVLVKSTFKPLLKKSSLLTRDPRTRQRRQVGTGGKARRRKQSPKR